MTTPSHHETRGGPQGIDHNSSAPPFTVPPGHVGPFVIPGTGRLVWWTGRVAIGLRYQSERRIEPPTQSSLWIQRLMLDGSGVIHAA